MIVASPFAEDRMILHAQDTNRLGPNHYKGPVSAIVVVCVCSRQRLVMFLFGLVVAREAEILPPQV